MGVEDDSKGLGDQPKVEPVVKLVPGGGGGGTGAPPLQTSCCAFVRGTQRGAVVEGRCFFILFTFLQKLIENTELDYGIGSVTDYT